MIQIFILRKDHAFQFYFYMAQVSIIQIALNSMPLNLQIGKARHGNGWEH